MSKLNQLVCILLVLTLFGCESAAQKQAKIEQENALAAQVKAKTDAAEKVKAELAAKAKAEAEAEAKKIAETKKNALTKILSKFVKTKDKFDQTVTYRHKNYNYYNNQNGTTLCANIQDGTIFANSVYVDDDWIFHKSFIVKVGEKTEEFDGKDTTNVVNDVIEDVYLNATDSNRLLNLIASADPKVPIMVRLLGKYRKDFTLRSSHRQALKDTWELYQLLK